MSASPREEGEAQNSEQSELTIERFRRVPINIYPENALTADQETPEDSSSVPAVPNKQGDHQSTEETDNDSEHDASTTELLLDEALPYRQKKVVHNIINDLYSEIESFEDERYSAPCCEVTTDCCTQCFSYSPCTKCCGNSVSEKMTTTLRTARSKGWKFFGKIAFPLFSGILREFFSDILRDIWVVFDFIIMIIGLCISGATFSLEHNSVFNILYLSLSCVSNLLAIVDIVCVLKQCNSCRACCGRKKGLDKEDDAGSKNGCCSRFKDASDIARMVLSEMLIYPLLICSIFTLTTGRGYEGRTHLALFGFFGLYVLSCFSLVFYNYFIRSLVLVGIIKGVKEVRTPSKEMLKKLDNYDPSIARSALCYLIFFSVYALLQMVVQVFTIVAVGAKIWYENYDPALTGEDTYTGNISYPETVFDPTIHASGHLIFMIVAGYVSPFLGFLGFFVVTYYWSQEFPIGLCIDLISIWKSGGKDDVLDIKNNFMVRKEVVQKTVDQFFRMETLVDDFKRLRDVSFFSKFTYPFRSPFLVVFCVGYGLLQATFAICAALTYDEMGTLDVYILDGGTGWVNYYIVACTIGAIANFYVLLVAAVWIILPITFLFCSPCIFLRCLNKEENLKHNPPCLPPPPFFLCP